MNVFNSQKLIDFFDQYNDSIGNASEDLFGKKNKQFIEVLEWLKHFDEYYAVINIKEKKVTWSYGIDTHLGYTKTEVEKEGIFFFRNIIHPFVREWHNLFACSALKMFQDKKNENYQIRKSRFIINIPVKKKNGNYVFVKQMLLPFQKDENNNVVSYLNVYTIVDEYKGQALRPRFFEDLKRKESWEKYIKKQASKIITILKDENLTEREFDFIDNYLFAKQKIADGDNLSLRNGNGWKKEVEITMDIEQVTIRSHIKNITRKIKLLFFSPFLDSIEGKDSSTYRQCLEPFDSFESGVIFLQKSGILSVLKNSFDQDSKIISKITNF